MEIGNFISVIALGGLRLTIKTEDGRQFACLLIGKMKASMATMDLLGTEKALTVVNW